MLDLDAFDACRADTVNSYERIINDEIKNIFTLHKKRFILLSLRDSFKSDST